jgi:hypothetical protein
MVTKSKVAHRTHTHTKRQGPYGESCALAWHDIVHRFVNFSVKLKLKRESESPRVARRWFLFFSHTTPTAHRRGTRPRTSHTHYALSHSHARTHTHTTQHTYTHTHTTQHEALRLRLPHQHPGFVFVDGRVFLRGGKPGLLLLPGSAAGASSPQDPA